MMLVACTTCEQEMLVFQNDILELTNSPHPVNCINCLADLRTYGTQPFYGKGLSELIKSIKPFLTAADLIMLREMRVGTGIKLQESE